MKNSITLNDICEKIQRQTSFTELKVMYRTCGPSPDYEDMLFGYCTVTKKMSGYEVTPDDGDDESYNMSDEIVTYQYNPPYFNGLVIWFESSWSPSEKEWHDDLIREMFSKG